MTKLDGKICLVTGASGRIGQAIVERCLTAGANVIALDVIQPTLAKCDNVRCDLGSLEEIQRLETYLKDKYTSINILVNNGAVGGGQAPLAEKTLEEFELVSNVNYRAPFLLMQMALRLKKDQDLNIVNIASIAARSAVTDGSLYSASKAALCSLTRSVGKEYADRGVRCNSVSPGWMDVPNVKGIPDEFLAAMHASVPMKRGGSPMEVANLVAWLASDEASYVNGTDFLIDGGKSA